MITLDFIHLLPIGAVLLSAVAGVLIKWPRMVTLDKLKASELAAKFLVEPVKLPTMYVLKDGEKRRVVAWEAAGPMIKNEARLIAATLQFWHAEEHFLYTTDEKEVEAMARTAALWWHGLKESDVPDDY